MFKFYYKKPRKHTYLVASSTESFAGIVFVAGVVSVSVVTGGFANSCHSCIWNHKHVHTA